MSQLKFIFLFISLITLGLGIISCAKSNDPSYVENQSLITNRTIVNPLIYKSEANYTIFYSKSTKNFYFVQHQNPIKLSGEISFHSFNESSFSVANSINEQILTFEIDVNGVYGIAKMKGIENRVFLQNFDWVDDDISEQVYCKCNGNGTSEKHCTSGGTGSTECSKSVTTGPITQECSTKCGSGTYACCFQD